ncbi:MAG: hypothetical protein NDI77_04130 [Geobacteraceae bacterium]|nr:hypothetical protein [Geobacteraceae bacterium]
MPEIAIDACVFIHLLNPQNNEGAHIDKLLRHLLDEKFMLLVDSTGKIAKDYVAQVIPMIRGAHEEGDQRILLTGWMMTDRHTSVALDPTDQLMTAIKNVIHELPEHADRAFVYVACKKDSALITNDEEHILSRSKDILKSTKKHRGANTTIVSSREAYEGIA